MMDAGSSDSVPSGSGPMTTHPNDLQDDAVSLTEAPSTGQFSGRLGGATVPIPTVKSPHEMTIAELQAQIGHLQMILHQRICGDPRECVQMMARPGLFVSTPVTAAHFSEPKARSDGQ